MWRKFHFLEVGRGSIPNDWTLSGSEIEQRLRELGETRHFKEAAGTRPR